MGALKLSAEEAAFVGERRVAYLATANPDGTPHVAPICPVLDVDRIVVSASVDAVKVRNLRWNPFSSVAFDEYAEDWDAIRNVIVFGKALVIESGPEFERDRGLLYEKFPQYETDEPIEEGAAVCIEIPIERVARLGFT